MLLLLSFHWFCEIPSTIITEKTLKLTRGKQLCLHHFTLYLLSAETDQLVNDVDQEWSNQVGVCDRSLYQPPQAVHHHKDVQKDVQIVCGPESIEGVPPGVGGGKNIHDNHN